MCKAILRILEKWNEEKDPERFYSSFDSRPGSHLQMLPKEEALMQELEADYTRVSENPPKVTLDGQEESQKESQ